MKTSTIALILGALVVLYLLMRRSVTGGATLSGSVGVGNQPNPYAGGMPPYPGYNMGPYGGPYGAQQQGTSGAQDFNQIAGGISQLVGAIGGALPGAIDAFSGGD